MTFLPALAPKALRFLVGGPSASMVFPSESTSFLAAALPRGFGAAFGFGWPLESRAGSFLERGLARVLPLAFAFASEEAAVPLVTEAVAAVLLAPHLTRSLLYLPLEGC